MKRHPFSMVEILLALGVVAIGICSVMVLFPVGASATRDAAMETYAANAADQILHMVKYELTRDGGSSWNTYICDNTSTAVGIALPLNSVDSLEDDIDDINNKWTDTNPLIGGNTLKSGIYSYTEGDWHYYQILVHRGSPNDSFSKVLEDNVIDFRGLATLWATKVNVQGVNLPLNFATRLHLKIEWPVELPASARQSAYYTLEVFNSK